ncbi:MAG: PEGA domain-containing protein [Lachnospira eligens]
MTSSGTSTSTAADNTSGYKVSITAPKGAVLYVNSEYIGTVPCSFDKSSGKKTITLSQNGYNTVSYTISIANTAGDLTYAFPEMISGGTQETTTRYGFQQSLLQQQSHLQSRVRKGDKSYEYFIFTTRYNRGRDSGSF